MTALIGLGNIIIIMLFIERPGKFTSSWEVLPIKENDNKATPEIAHLCYVLQQKVVWIYRKNKRRS